MPFFSDFRFFSSKKKDFLSENPRKSFFPFFSLRKKDFPLENQGKRKKKIFL